jgi:hypothetical protein
LFFSLFFWKKILNFEIVSSQEREKFVSRANAREREFLLYYKEEEEEGARDDDDQKRDFGGKW